jgi:hypothetical protein
MSSTTSSSLQQPTNDIKSMSEFLFTKNSCRRIRNQQKQQQQQQLRFDEEQVAVSSTSMWNSIAAGYMAGICGIIIGHPLDSIKVMLQTQSAQMVSPITLRPTLVARAGSATVHTAAMPLHFLQQRQQSSMAIATMNNNISHNNTQTTTSKAQSFKRLYAGAKGPLMTAGIIQSINFCIYDSIRRILHSHYQGNSRAAMLHKDSLVNIAIASTFSGAATTIFTSPLIIIKTKQQLTGWNFQRALRETAGRSTTTTTTTTTRRRTSMVNLKNFYVGFGPHLFACSVGRGVYMCAYELIKQQMAHRKQQQQQQQQQQLHHADVSLQERMVCAALAGMTCWSVIYPLDALQNQMYKQALTTSSSTTTTNNTMTTYEMASTMYRHNGMKAFYRGFGVTILRAGPVAAAVLPVFDMSLEWLNQNNN